MESNQPESRISLGLPIANMSNHRGNLGFRAGNKLDYSVKQTVELNRPRPQVSHVRRQPAAYAIVTSVATGHADNPGDRSPVFFRYAFRHASSSAFRFRCRD